MRAATPYFSVAMAAMCHQVIITYSLNIHLAKLQTYGIFRFMDRVWSRRVWITDIQLYY